MRKSDRTKMNEKNEDDKYYTINTPTINSTMPNLIKINSTHDQGIKINSLNYKSRLDDNTPAMRSSSIRSPRLIMNMRTQSSDYSTLEEDNVDVPNGDLFNRRYDHYLNKRKLPSKSEDQLSLVENMSGLANGLTNSLSNGLTNIALSNCLDSTRLDDEVFDYESSNEELNQKKKVNFRYSNASAHSNHSSNHNSNESLDDKSDDKNDIDLISFTDDTTITADSSLKRKDDEQLKNYHAYLEDSANGGHKQSSINRNEDCKNELIDHDRTMEINHQHKSDHLKKQLSNELLEAARTGNEESLIAALKKYDVNCHASDGRKSTPLHLAAGYNRSRIVEILLKHGANVHAQDKGGLVPLHNACSYGHYDVCETLIMAGANVNAMDYWRFTPLHEAAAKVKVEVCSLLLRCRADPYLKDVHGKTAIDVAGSEKLKERITYEYRGYLFLGYIRNGEYSKLKKLYSVNSVQNHQSQFNGTADSTSDHLLTSSSPSSFFSSSFHKSSSSDNNSLLVPIDKSSPNSSSNCTVANQFTPDLIYFKNSYNGCSPLHYIADASSSVSSAKRKQITDFLIKKRASINETNNEGLTPLVMALENNYLEVADCLLKNKARMDITDNSGRNPLHRMAQGDNYQAVQLLLSYNADISALTSQGLTAEQLTSSESIKKLLINHKLISNNPEFKLLDAARNGDLSVVNAILEADSQLVNCQDVDGRQSTPLHFAAGYNHPKVVKCLLEHGADIQAKDKGGLVPLHNSCSYGHYEVAELLIKYGADVNVTDQWDFSPLHEAASKSKPDIVRLLLKHGADPKKKNSNGKIPLDLVKSDDEEVRDLLMGDASLLDAAKCGNLQRVMRLLTPENVNCKDTEGRNSTALHLASGYNNIEVAEYLLQHGAHVNIPDKGGLIPLHNAASYGHLDVADLLIRYNTNVNATDRWGFTPLHEASQKGRTPLCALLLNHGADPTLRNLENQTALDLATAEDVRCLLMDAMAPLDLKSCASSNSKDSKNKNCLTTTNTESATVISNEHTLNEQQIFSGDGEDSQEVNDLNRKLTKIISGNSRNYSELHQNANRTRNSSPNNVFPNNQATPNSSSIYEVPSAANLLLLQKNSANVNEDNTPDSNKPDGSSHVTNTMSYRSNKTQDRNTSSSSPSNSPTLETKSSTTSLNALSTGSNESTSNNTKAIVSISSYIDKGDLPSISMQDFLTNLNLPHLVEMFEKEMISIDILAEMGHEELKQIGVQAYGHRHKLLKAVEKLLLHTAAMQQKQQQNGQSSTYSMFVDSSLNSSQSDVQSRNAKKYFQTSLVDLMSKQTEFKLVEEMMQSTKREHKDGHAGGKFSSYKIHSIQRILNQRLWERYLHRRKEICEENRDCANEKMLFHGSLFVNSIVQKGFDERHAYIGGMFGAGIYFAENSSKSNQYVYGMGGGVGCPAHKDKSCYICKRQMLLCRVALGKSFFHFSALKLAHAPPGHHSIIGRPSGGGLTYPEYVVYRGEQSYPEYLVTYSLVP